MNSRVLLLPNLACRKVYFPVFSDMLSSSQYVQLVASSPRARFSLDALDACILDPRQRMEPFLFWEGFTYDAPSRLSLDAEDRSMFLSAVRVRKLRVGGEGLSSSSSRLLSWRSLLTTVVLILYHAQRPGKVTKPRGSSHISFSCSFLLFSFLPSIFRPPSFSFSLSLSMDIDFSTRMYPPRDGRFSLTPRSIHFPSQSHLVSSHFASL